MTTDETLAAILAAVQIDPGNRGLAAVPGDNLFTATAGDFAAACRSLAETSGFRVSIVTGFCIPSVSPPTFETDGPLGAFFLERAFEALSGFVEQVSDEPVMRAIGAARRLVGHRERTMLDIPQTHKIVIERPGRAADGKRYSMRGVDVDSLHNPRHTRYAETPTPGVLSIGIGDGGNEVGMGRIPHETVVANIPNGDLVHCRVPTDRLIVAGVSNWGADALAAGVFAVRGVRPPAGLFDPDRERAILDVMVREGPLVDGVTGKRATSVDGLTWGQFVEPFERIAELLAP
jgi:D-glutamate cyclase